MNHYTMPQFWQLYNKLPREVRALADKNYELLKASPAHPSLRFKKVGKYCSVRVGEHYRAVSVPYADGYLWFWIGTHAEYDTLLS